MKKELNPNKIFYEHIETLIKNLLIDNKNYSNGHYFDLNGQVFHFKLLKDTKERANYILKEMKQTKHLIDL